MANGYVKSPVTMVFALICLIIGIALISLVLYLVPYILPNVTYPVPQFVIHFRQILFENHGLNNQLQVLAILIPLALLGFLFLYLSRYFVHFEEKDALEEAHNPTNKFYQPTEREAGRPTRSRRIHPSVIHVLVVLGVLLLVILSEWLILG